MSVEIIFICGLVSRHCLTGEGMIRIKDHKQLHLFDPWGFLSPKRRQILEQGWSGLFREHLLEESPVEQMAFQGNLNKWATGLLATDPGAGLGRFPLF